MIDPITICTLITVIVTSLLQISQLYIDYKRDKINSHDSLYELRNFQSNCCVFDTDNK